MSINNALEYKPRFAFAPDNTNRIQTLAWQLVPINCKLDVLVLQIYFYLIADGPEL